MFAIQMRGVAKPVYGSFLTERPLGIFHIAMGISSWLLVSALSLFAKSKQPNEANENLSVA